MIADVRAEEGAGVHVPHGFLRQHRDRAVGGRDHLQDEEELALHTGHAVQQGAVWRPRLRNLPRLLSLLLSRARQRSPHVPYEVSPPTPPPHSTLNTPPSHQYHTPPYHL